MFLTNAAAGTPERSPTLDPVGVIDIGSNSVRLVIYENLSRSPVPLFNEKVLCGLGKSVATTGHLGVDAKARALRALARFHMIAQIRRVRRMHVLATAAVREAADGATFIAACEQLCGQPLTVLSGEQEATYAAAGILMGFREPNGLAGDLGGGSLELIDVRAGALAGAVTLPLGGLRLIDVCQGDKERAAKLIDEHLRRTELLSLGTGRTFYTVGGTWRAFARLHMAEINYPLGVAHGYRIKTSDAIEFCTKLRSKKPSSLKGIEDIAAARRDIIPFGALVLEGLLKRIQPVDVATSVFGIREGLLYSLLSKEEQGRDPLISFCQEYARLHARSPEHASELCDWTDALFVPTGPEETPDERRLRHAACLISDIGWRAHPDYRGEQSLNMIAHAALAGIDHPGRAFLALAVYFRHTGQVKDELGAKLTELANRRAIKRARIVGAAIRAAHMLSIGVEGVVAKVKLSYEDQMLVMTVPPALASLSGERLDRRFGVLADLLDRKPEIRVGAQ